MRPGRILIIEDHTSVRTLLARVLEDAGYQVFEAVNGRQGLEQFRAQPVDLVITDLEMPEMNGLEVILELTRAFLDVKVTAMTGHSASELSMAKLLGVRQTFVSRIGAGSPCAMTGAPIPSSPPSASRLPSSSISNNES